MKEIKSLDELKDGDIYEVQELKVNSGGLGTFRGIYSALKPSDESPPYFHYSYESFQVKNNELLVPKNMVIINKGGYTVDLSKINKNHRGAMAVTKRFEDGWYRIRILDSWTEGNISIKPF